MSVKELKIILNDLPDDMEVILQKDAEGNGYSPLCDCDANAVYIPHSTYSGDVYSVNDSAEDVYMTEEDWDKTKALPRALILCPVN